MAVGVMFLATIVIAQGKTHFLCLEASASIGALWPGDAQ